MQHRGHRGTSLDKIQWATQLGWKWCMQGTNRTTWWIDASISSWQIEHGSNSSVIVTGWNKSKHRWIWCCCKDSWKCRVSGSVNWNFRYISISSAVFSSGNISWGSSRPFTDSMAIPGCICWQGWLRFHLSTAESPESPSRAMISNAWSGLGSATMRPSPLPSRYPPTPRRCEGERA